ncbi:MAG TPA: RNA-binding domain-containing protein, partial [Nitrososphaerales archaeon]
MVTKIIINKYSKELLSLLRKRKPLHKEKEIWTIQIEFFIHATEDENRVTKAVSDMLQIPNESFEKSELEGHHGNRIIMFKANIKRKEGERLVNRVVSMIDNFTKKNILFNIQSNIDEHGALYFRWNKQSILLNRVEQSQVDAVRIKIKPVFKKNIQEAIELYKEALT